MSSIKLPLALFFKNPVLNFGQKAIGLNGAVLNEGFIEALNTYIHEVAHNKEMKHDNAFIHTVQALYGTAIDGISKTANKAASGEPLTNDDRVILDIQREWDALRQAS